MDVKTLCLGVLNKGDASGYEIKKHFEEGPFSYFHEAGYGSIYPALTRLTELGHVSCTEMAQEGRPDKKVYAITPAGRRALVDALAGEPARDKLRSDFVFMMFFAHLMDAERVERMIAERLAWYRENIERMEACQREDTGTDAASASERFVCGMGLAIYRAAAAYLEENGQSLVDSVRRAGPQAAE